MRIPNQNISVIRYVNSIRETSDFFTSNATFEIASFWEYDDAMALEIAHIKIISWKK